MSVYLHPLERLFSTEGSTPEQRQRLLSLLEQLRHLTKGVASGASLPGLLGAMATVLAGEGPARSEDGCGEEEAQARVAAMMARVVGYDERRGLGRTLWSARGAVLAALRVAIARQSPDARRKGVPRNLYCFASEAADEGVLEAVETTGIGGYHLIRVRTRADGSMDPVELREKMLAVVAGGDIPAFLVASCGKVGSSALDDVKELREVADSITTLYGLKPVHLHADAAWSGLYGVFNDYDFHGNPLGFEPPVLEALARIRMRVQHLRLADSVGLDFRWSGRAAYPVGLFLLRNGADPSAASLVPGEAPSALVLHALLRGFGQDGYRRLLADSLQGELAARDGGEGQRLKGGVEAEGVPSGLTPEMLVFSGALSPRLRPRS